MRYFVGIRALDHDMIGTWNLEVEVDASSDSGARKTAELAARQWIIEANGGVPKTVESTWLETRPIVPVVRVLLSRPTTR